MMVNKNLLQRRMAAAALIGILAVAATACGSGSPSKNASKVNPNASESNPPGDIPDSQVFVPYKPVAGGWTVKVPEGWAQSPANGSVVFSDKLNSITLTASTSAKAPTAASVTQAVQQEYAKRPGFAGLKTDTVARKGGQAIHAAFRANSLPDAVTGKAYKDDIERYVYFKSGKEIDITVAGTQGSDNVDPWRVVTDSFQWKP